MSILEPYLKQAHQLGIDPKSKIGKPAMIFVLQKADSLNLLSYKPGMEQDWLAATQFWARKHHWELCLQDLLAGLLHLATTERNNLFLKPLELFDAIENFYVTNYLVALGARQSPPLPPEIELDINPRREQAYLAAWRTAARASGDYQHATRSARQAIGLPPDTPTIEAGTHSLAELSTTGLLK